MAWFGLCGPPSRGTALRPDRLFAGPPFRPTAPNFALFSLSRHSFHSFSLPLVGPFVEFWWCLKRQDPQICMFGVLGLSYETPASLSRRGFTRNFGSPTPFGPRPSGPQPSGGPPFGGPPFGAPRFLGSGPHPSGPPSTPSPSPNRPHADHPPKGKKRNNKKRTLVRNLRCPNQIGPKSAWA